MIQMTGKRKRNIFGDIQQSTITYVCSDDFLKTINKGKIQNITNDVLIGTSPGVQLLQQGLKKINMLGFITFRMYYGNNVQYEQTAEVLFFDPCDWHPWMPNPHKKYFVKLNYKAYLCGYIKVDKACKFYKMINENTDKICFFSKKKQNMPVLLPLRENLIDDYILSTKGWSDKSYDDIVCTTNTIIPSGLVFDDTDLMYCSEKMLKEKALCENSDVVCLYIVDPVFGRRCYETGGLFEDVIRCLEHQI
jgi:hypothetical protein